MITYMLLSTATPSPPQTPSYTVEQYGQYRTILTVQWQPPQYDGGAPVNYTITVSPGLSPVTTVAPSALFALPYNVMHTLRIVATNCNGSSSATMESIRIGTYVGVKLPTHNLVCLDFNNCLDR